MKAIILTYAGVSKEEKELLKNTDVFKIACNDYCAEFKPNIRLCADDIVQKCLDCDTCPVISLNYDLERERVINGCKMPKRHSSLLSCIDWLYLNGYDKILLVASNPVSPTCTINYEGIDILKQYLYLFKYTKDGNFDIPHKTIKEFLMLSEEDLLLGLTEPKKQTYAQETIFTDACKFEIHTEGLDNKSIESGELLKNILPVDVRAKFLNGEDEIIYNGIVIKKLTELKPKKIEEPEEEPEVKKPVKKPVKKTTKRK